MKIEIILDKISAKLYFIAGEVCHENPEFEDIPENISDDLKKIHDSLMEFSDILSTHAINLRQQK